MIQLNHKNQSSLGDAPAHELCPKQNDDYFKEKLDTEEYAGRTYGMEASREIN